MDKLMESDYAATIRREARTVARNFARTGGGYHFGYEVFTAEDLAQEVYLALAVKGTTVEDLDAMDNGHAWLNTFIRNQAFNLARREVGGLAAARKNLAAKQKRPRVEVTDTIPETGDMAPSAEEDYLTDEDERNRSATARRVRIAAEAVVERILGSTSESSARILRLIYAEGLDAPEVAARLNTSPGSVRKALQRARRSISPDDEASLRLYRSAYFPGARSIQSNLGIEGEPTALLEAL